MRSQVAALLLDFALATVIVSNPSGDTVPATVLDIFVSHILILSLEQPHFDKLYHLRQDFRLHLRRRGRRRDRVQLAGVVEVMGVLSVPGVGAGEGVGPAQVVMMTVKIIVRVAVGLVKLTREP